MSRNFQFSFYFSFDIHDVEFIVGLLGHGWTEAEMLENYPHIVQEDIRTCLVYASAVLRTQKDHQHPMKLADASISG